jgi:hypothetical protein
MADAESFSQKWKRTSWRDRALLAETLIVLAVASAAITILPFKRIGALASRSSNVRPLSEDERKRTVWRVRWAVQVCAARVPWKALCFQQGLAAQWLLRRRGIASRMYYGAKPDAEKGLAAHVWVRDGDFDVIGCEISKDFAVLTTFPSTKA